MTQPNQSYELLLTGGHVIDPANEIDAPMDVAIQDGKIAAVEPSISTNLAAKTIDVSGLIVTPGILDIHTHVYPFKPSSKSYVESPHADAHLLASGVTTTVDAGTAGWEHFLDFKEGTIDRMKVRILAFLNIARSGMVDASSEQNPALMEAQLAASMVQAFPEILIGIKTAHYWTRDPWGSVHTPWASVDKALEAAELCGKPVMVDFWPRPPERSYQDLILKKLRPGDFHTHVFAQQFPILNESKKVNDFMFQARQRGVHFDLGHGAASFWYRNAAPAVQGGFPPDTISTDLHMANINGPVLSMQQTMSKMLNLGMPLVEVIERSTNIPAEQISHPELGRLTPGSEADIAVFQLQEGNFTFADCGRARLSGSRRFECQLTLRAGQVLFNPSGLGMPEWQDAPPAYWQIPS